MSENPMGSREPKARVSREAVRSTKSTVSKLDKRIIALEAKNAVPEISQ